MEKEKKLSGLNVVFFESRHSKTLGDLIALQGAVPLAAPAMKEIPLEGNQEAFLFAERLFKGEIDILILLTGVGTRYLAGILETKYSHQQIIDVLKKTILIPRGPKSVRVLNEWKVPYALNVPEPNTWNEILTSIDENPGVVGASLKGKTVAVQEYGVSNPDLLSGLERRGARVVRVPIYLWALPDDLKPLTEAILKIISGQVQVALFTTAVQIEHVLEVAVRLDLQEALKAAFKKIVVASVGPDCSEALRNRGVEVDIQPESPRMGPLVVAVADGARAVLKKKGSVRQ